MQLALLGASLYDIFESLDSRTCLSIVTFFLSYLILKFVYFIDIHFIFWTIYWNFRGSKILGLPKEKLAKEFKPDEHFGDVQKQVEESLKRGSAKLRRLIPLTNPILKYRFEHAWSNVCPNITPRLVFHGTRNANIPSIIRRGLLVPGFHSGVRVVNGSAYGVGIYLATEANTSMGYVRDGNKMFVCAVLPHHEKVSSHGNVFVAKDSWFVLPIFLAEFERYGGNYSSKPQRIILHIINGAVFLITAALIFHWTGKFTFSLLHHLEIPLNPLLSRVEYVHSWVDWIFMGLFSVITWIMWIIWKVVYYFFWGVTFILSIIRSIVVFFMPYVSSLLGLLKSGIMTLSKISYS